MTEYALVDPSNDVREFRQNIDLTAQTKAGYRWLPVERSTTGAGPVSEPAVTTVLADKVTVVTNFRAYTVQEISDQRDSIAGQFDGVDNIVRAAVLVIMDELNRHSTFHDNLKAAIAAATSLANLQTRIAAVNGIPQRTAADLKTAIRNKLGNGS